MNKEITTTVLPAVRSEDSTGRWLAPYDCTVLHYMRLISLCNTSMPSKLFSVHIILVLEKHVVSAHNWSQRTQVRAPKTQSCLDCTS